MVSGITAKANLFNNFFAPECSSNTLPTFSYKTQKQISNFERKEDDILLMTKILNPNKAHWWDNVSIRMIQLCLKSIVKPLKYLFYSSLTACIFLEDWKKDNIIPVYNNESENWLKNHRLIGLLPTFNKIFERQIMNAFLNFFLQN